MTNTNAMSVMKEQLKKGYLKLAILYALLRGPMHGYDMIKKIREYTLGLISPTAGSLYPALRELENSGFIRGEWRGDRRRIKVYMITERGKEAFREVIERHFSLASAVRRWLLSQLAPIHPIEDHNAVPEIMQRAVKIVLLGSEAPINERINFLKDFRESLKRVKDLINNLIINIDKRIRDLEEEARGLGKLPP